MNPNLIVFLAFFSSIGAVFVGVVIATGIAVTVGVLSEFRKH